MNEPVVALEWKDHRGASLRLVYRGCILDQDAFCIEELGCDAMGQDRWDTVLQHVPKETNTRSPEGLFAPHMLLTPIVGAMAAYFAKLKQNKVADSATVE